MPEEKYTMDHRNSASDHRGKLVEELERRRLLSAALANIQWHGQTVQAFADSYVVDLKTGTNFTAIAAKKNFTDIDNLGGGFYSFDSSAAPSSVAQWGANSDDVITITPNTPVYAQSVPTPSTPAVLPNDTYFQSGDQYDMYNYGQPIVNTYGVTLNGTAGDDIDATQAWTISTGSSSTVVAILDTGVDLTHPDLQNNIWTNPGDIANNGLDDDSDGYIDDVHGWNFSPTASGTLSNNNNVNDDNGHGTAVAGIIGAQGNNGQGIAGVNWNISMIPVKVLDANGVGSAASVIAGVEYITTLKNLWVATGGKDGANITAANLSLGDTTYPGTYDQISARAFEQAGDAGIIIVTAAGNGNLTSGSTETNFYGSNLDTAASFPGKYSLNLSNVITVASVDNQGNLSLFSNYGDQTVQIAAPGEDIWSTYPDSIPVETISGGFINTVNVSYYAQSGTSFAAPHITGILALMASVEPNATAAQLKQALFSSVDPLPSLEGLTSTAANKVTTGGEANAYKALLAIQNIFVQTDTYTKGNWQGFGTGNIYGSSGAYIAGQSTTFPSGVNITGGTTVVYGDSTKAINKNQSALQLIGDPTDRIEAGMTSATNIDVSLNLAAPEQVTLYLADYDNQKRSETVSVIDPSTGNSISGQYAQKITSFSGGEYVTYDLTGNVELQIARTAGPNAILNGVFLDPVPTSAAPGAAAYAHFASTNTTAGGNFQSSFGSQGVYLPGQSTNFPSFVNVTTSGATTVSGGGNKTNQLQNASGTGTVKTYFSSPTEIDLNMDFNDGLVHQTTFYAADLKNKGIAERIEVVDPSTGNVLATQDLSSFKAGEYATFDLSGSVEVRIIRLAGPAAVLGGVFFDAPPGGNASYSGVDTTTEGNWMGQYGNAGSYIPGVTSSTTISLGSDYSNGTAALTINGATTQTNTAKTKDKSALETTSGIIASRTLNRLVARNSFTITVDFSDTATHELSLYFVDSDTNNQRSELVQVASGTSTAQQQISDFKTGKYVTFNVRGTTTITISNVRGPSAVLNGLFID
ncbi:MAG TPA: S8 family peptidase [Tepidisphaeraceae bacterium]|jgi:subtilisin family serine protease